MRASSLFTVLLVTIPFTLGTPADLQEREEVCATGYKMCVPSGATTTTVPQIGSQAFNTLFASLIKTNLPDGNAKRSLRQPDLNAADPLLSPRATASLCCNKLLSCYAMANLAIPFCYDRFTTNYFLPDASYGTLYFGTYTSAAGDVANLISGNYTLASGAMGNLYASDAADKPNTSTMSIPSQFTGSGVGSAVPASLLGATSLVQVTITMTLPGTTVVGTTINSTRTISSSGSGGAVFITETVASTVFGTTQTAVVTTVTTQVPISGASVSTSGSATAAATSKNVAAGAGARREEWMSIGAAIAVWAGFLL